MGIANKVNARAMISKGYKLGTQQLMVLFLVGRNPGITRTSVREYFLRHDLPFEGIDRRLRELESRKLIDRKKTNAGTKLRLSKIGQQAFDHLSVAFQTALSGSLTV